MIIIHKKSMIFKNDGNGMLKIVNIIINIYKCINFHL